MKEKLIHFFVTNGLTLIGKLPFSALYFIADYFLFPVLFYVIAYRRNVVVENLKNAFPSYSIQEIATIEKDYFHYLADLILETIKGFQMPENELFSRMWWDRGKGIDPFVNDGNILFTFGHYGNYEWLNLAISAQQKWKLYIPFRQVTSKSMNDFLKQKREKFGSYLFPTEATSNMILKAKKEQSNFAFFLANDQAAPLSSAYLTHFLNQPTTFFKGTEKIAEILNLPVVFISIQRKKRGFYTYHFELISANAANEQKGFCLEKHAQCLEKEIQEEPSLWLWSHRRWKYKP